MDPSSAAWAQLESAYRGDPSSRLFAPLADAYRGAGRLQEALQLLQEGTRLHPDYVSAWVLLGLCQRDLSGGQAAEITFAHVLSLDPENLVALKHRASRALEEGDPATSAAIVERVLEIDPYDRQALSLRDDATSRQEAPPASQDTAVPTPAPPVSQEIRPTPAEPVGSRQSGDEVDESEPPILDLEEIVPEEEISEASAPGEVDADLHADWQVQRDADRIVIRPAPEKVPGATPSQADDFSTLTLARIYESQGYDEKALAIYEALQQREPENQELIERLRAVKERLGQRQAPAPAAAEAETAERRWRLLDAGNLAGEPEQAAEQLRQLSDQVRDQEEDKRHTVIGRAPGEMPTEYAEPPGSDEPDFERFLRYVRSLKR